jgi:hypothetical protein
MPTGLDEEVPSTAPPASSAPAAAYSGVPWISSVVSKPERAASAEPASAPGWVAVGAVVEVAAGHAVGGAVRPMLRVTCRPGRGLHADH